MTRVMTNNRPSCLRSISVYTHRSQTNVRTWANGKKCKYTCRSNSQWGYEYHKNVDYVDIASFVSAGVSDVSIVTSRGVNLVQSSSQYYHLTWPWLHEWISLVWCMTQKQLCFGQKNQADRMTGKIEARGKWSKRSQTVDNQNSWMNGPYR